MLQQTRMNVVLKYFGRFVTAFPDVATLANASDDHVAAAWSGLGYYRRAKMLRAGALAVVRHYGGRIPASVETLRTLPGIGRYTAGAIASIAHGHRAPIVDGNVARIVSRLRGIADPFGSTTFVKRTWAEAETLVANCDSPRDFNQGLMEIGALLCRPSNPICSACPLRSHCVAHRDDTAEAFPVRRAKPATRSLRIPVYVVRDDRGRVLMRREKGALMTGLFHLPQGKGLFETPPLSITRQRRAGAFRHTVTNRRIEFVVYAAQLRGKPAAGLRWFDPEEVIALPQPSYVTKALRIVRL